MTKRFLLLYVALFVLGLIWWVYFCSVCHHASSLQSPDGQHQAVLTFRKQILIPIEGWEVNVSLLDRNNRLIVSQRVTSIDIASDVNNFTMKWMGNNRLQIHEYGRAATVVSLDAFLPQKTDPGN